MDPEHEIAKFASLLEQAVARHGARRDSLIPILSDLNRGLGYLPVGALGDIRRRLLAPEVGLFLADSHLYSAASFYHLFSLQPRGRHVIHVCESPPCHVRGGCRVQQALRAALRLAPGETSADRHWSLLTTSCRGVCGVAPVFWVDGEAYGNVAAQQVPEILARYD
jgi:NADH:ubiquinone oxidoreductase subunit E